MNALLGKVEWRKICDLGFLRTKTIYSKILFYIVVEAMKNMVIVSGARQSNSAIHKHVSIHPQIQGRIFERQC